MARLLSLFVLLACLLASVSSQTTTKSAKPRGKLVGKSPSTSVVGKVLPPNAWPRRCCHPTPARRHSPTHLAATSQRAAAEPVVHLSRQLRLAMLTWYCAEGSGHVEDRPCQNFNFMHSAAGLKAPL